MPAIFTPTSNVSHPEVVPYISLADYIAAPTGVDTTALIPGSTTTANAVELSNVIRRASAWANNICYQILGSTLDTQTSSGIKVRADGTIRVMCDFWPVLEVDSFSVGLLPSLMAAVADTSDIWLNGRKVLIVPVTGISSPTTTGFPGAVRVGSLVYCQWQYWNGWIHTTLASSVLANATTLDFNTTLPAAAAGQTVAIWDGANTERVQIATSFTGGTSATLTNPTQFAHTLPTAPDYITVTALPDDVRQAVISLTSALIKTRGAESYEMASVGQNPSKSDMIEGGGLEDMSIAVDLLDRYRRVA